MGEATRWTVNVALETDVQVRTYLAQSGMDAGDLSRFVEESAKWRLLELACSGAGVGFEDLSPEEMNALIDEAVADARKH